jgi:hypothetical protein
VGDAGAAGAAGAGGGRLYSISVDADMSRARGVSMGYMSRARGVRRATGDRAEWHACLHRNSMQVASAKHNVSTGWLALPHPQRFDWTKGFCVSLGLVIWAVLHWGVVASLCATAPIYIAYSSTFSVLPRPVRRARRARNAVAPQPWRRRRHFRRAWRQARVVLCMQASEAWRQTHEAWL